MKKIAMPLLGLTTLTLFVVVLFSVMNLPFGWVFGATVFGQTLLVVAVYKVLTDDYKTQKTFKDFYEDCPVRSE